MRVVKYQLAIFDFDGTLADSLPRLMNILNRLTPFLKPDKALVDLNQQSIGSRLSVRRGTSTKTFRNEVVRDDHSISCKRNLFYLRGIRFSMVCGYSACRDQGNLD